MKLYYRAPDKLPNQPIAALFLRRIILRSSSKLFRHGSVGRKMTNLGEGAFIGDTNQVNLPGQMSNSEFSITKKAPRFNRNPAERGQHPTNVSALISYSF